MKDGKATFPLLPLLYKITPKEFWSEKVATGIIKRNISLLANQQQCHGYKAHWGVQSPSCIWYKNKHAHPLKEHEFNLCRRKKTKRSLNVKHGGFPPLSVFFLISTDSILLFNPLCSSPSGLWHPMMFVSASQNSSPTLPSPWNTDPADTQMAKSGFSCLANAYI